MPQNIEPEKAKQGRTGFHALVILVISLTVIIAAYAAIYLSWW